MKNIQFICVNNPRLLNNSQFRVVLCGTGPLQQPHLQRNESVVGQEGPDYGQRQTDGRQPVGPVGPEFFVNFWDKDRPTDPSQAACGRQKSHPESLGPGTDHLAETRSWSEMRNRFIIVVFTVKYNNFQARQNPWLIDFQQK